MPRETLIARTEQVRVNLKRVFLLILLIVFGHFCGDEVADVFL